MKRRHYIIYIPGLGDHYDPGRKLALRMWRIFGIRTQFVPMQWDKPGDYTEKLRRIKEEVATAQKAGYSVSLVGESAGASAALNTAAITPGLHHVITLAGVNSSDLPISPVTRKRSPAFAIAAAKINESLKQVDTSRIHTIRGLTDRIVWTRYNDIPGAKNHTVFTFGHFFTIVACLTVLSPYVISIAKGRS